MITHEPTFYNHTDVTTRSKTIRSTWRSSIYQGQPCRVAVPRPRARPAAGPARRRLGPHARLDAYASPAERRIYIVPQTTLGALATDVARRLNARAIRVVGDPEMKVNRDRSRPGSACRADAGVDIAVGGETTERRQRGVRARRGGAGQTAGMVMLGHMMSEDWGCRRSRSG